MRNAVSPAKKPLVAEKLFTALHIGASSVSMMVAERGADGIINPIDFLEQPAPVARDIFRNGVVSASTTERVVSIIKGYQKSLAELGLDPHAVTRAVATNILSEATNHETFMNRIRIACGLRIGTIDDGEMTRLIYLKTRRRLLMLPTMRQHTTLVLHVGPGNTRALLFQDGLITRYTSYRMGTHRTREAVDGSHAEGSAMLRVIREHAYGNLAQIRFDYSDVAVDGLHAQLLVDPLELFERRGRRRHHPGTPRLVADGRGEQVDHGAGVSQIPLQHPVDARGGELREVLRGEPRERAEGGHRGGRQIFARGENIAVEVGHHSH